jgi:demethylmenaquinone methyltransferase / 2-methoxy-6-polyprenyl-1,4-benzoquinol methylase
VALRFHNYFMHERKKINKPEALAPGRIEQMFSGIVPWYDFLNRCLSLRQDIYWRRALVQGLALPPQPLILDLAAGTLDVSLELFHQRPQARIAAADFSLPMLHKGQEKLAVQGQHHICPIAADAYALPFPRHTFDALTIAFGIRNLWDRSQALKEMHRVLRPGGIAGILEFVPPESGWLQNIYTHYLNRLLPLIGRIFSQHAFAYNYLAESIHSFPRARAFSQQMHEAGFRQIRHQALTFGVVYLFYGQKAREEC